MKVSYFVIFLKNFFIYSNELRAVKAEIRLNGGRLRGSLLYYIVSISENRCCSSLQCGHWEKIFRRRPIFMRDSFGNEDTDLTPENQMRKRYFNPFVCQSSGVHNSRERISYFVCLDEIGKILRTQTCCVWNAWEMIQARSQLHILRGVMKQKKNRDKTSYR